MCIDQRRREYEKITVSSIHLYDGSFGSGRLRSAAGQFVCAEGSTAYDALQKLNEEGSVLADTFSFLN